MYYAICRLPEQQAEGNAATDYDPLVDKFSRQLQFVQHRVAYVVSKSQPNSQVVVDVHGLVRLQPGFMLNDVLGFARSRFTEFYLDGDTRIAEAARDVGSIAWVSAARRVLLKQQWIDLSTRLRGTQSGDVRNLPHLVTDLLRDAKALLGLESETAPFAPYSDVCSYYEFLDLTPGEDPNAFVTLDVYVQ